MKFVANMSKISERRQRHLPVLVTVTTSDPMRILQLKYKKNIVELKPHYGDSTVKSIYLGYTGWIKHMESFTWIPHKFHKDAKHNSFS